MDEACTKYTLNFNGNSATTNNLTSQDLDFDSTINLADISSSDKIARTGYTLTGWKDQSGNLYGITGEADINPNDLASVTLTAQWRINSHTVTINKGSNVTTVTGAGSYDYNSTVTISATAFSTGYHFSGWTVNSGGVTLYSDEAMTTQSTTSTPAYFTMPDNDVTITANAAANTYTIAYNANGGSGTTSSQSVTYNGGNVTLRANNFSRSGYTFQGWSRSSGSSNTVHYNANTAYSINTLASNAGVTNTNGGTISLYAVWKENVADCSSTVHPTTTTGCKMKDGNTWIYGNNGNTTTWAVSYTCPTGYSSPTKAVFDSLVSAHSSNQLYSVLGLSSTRQFWSSTQNASDTSRAYFLDVDSSGAYVYNGYSKTKSLYVLCYK